MNECQNVIEVTDNFVEKENRNQFVDFIAMLINKYGNVLFDKCEN